MTNRWVLLLVALLALEGIAWFICVPQIVGRWTFVQLNGLVLVMFVTGLVSAMGGHPRRSFAEILSDLQRPSGRTRPQ
jgi:hypothetical protein